MASFGICTFCGDQGLGCVDGLWCVGVKVASVHALGSGAIITATFTTTATAASAFTAAFSAAFATTFTASF